MFGRVRVCACETTVELHVRAVSCVHAEQRAPEAEKFGLANISVVHSQNVPRKSNIYFYATHFKSIRFCDLARQ